MEGRGRVRRRQGTGRAGRAPGPQLDLLAPVDHPGPALLRVPGRPGSRPARRLLPARRPPDPADLPRDPPAVHRPVPAADRTRRAAALVAMATPTPGHRPRLPLPPTSTRTHITK